MTDTFSVGEVAIYVRPGSPYFGREVTILSPLELGGGGPDHITGKITELAMLYTVDLPAQNGIAPMGAKPEWLKKKQHKRDIDQIVSWEDCLWKPSEVRV